MRFLSAVTLLVLAPLVGACASASPSKGGDRPDLIIPPPPPHVIPITSEPVIEPVADVPSPPAAASAPANRAGRGTRETPAKPPAEAKPEVKPDAPPPDTPAPVTPPPPPAPAPQLRTIESTAAESAIRSTVDRTRGLLATVDYRNLSNTRKKAYEDSKRLAQQAEDALKEGNTAFAKGVADKAETLAKALAGG